MTAADGDDDDRPAGDETRPDGDSHGAVDRTDATADGTDDTPAVSADGGEVTPEGSEMAEATAEAPAASGELEMPDGESGIEGAPDDEEMPLTEHIEEMLGRLLAVIVVMGGVAALVFWVADSAINFLWYSYLPQPPDGITQCGDVPADEVDACPRVYHPLSLLLARMKVASLAGLIVALPVFVYQTYLFMRPGLYPNERRYYLAAVPTSLLLALVGVAFAYFLILPILFEYFLFYSEDVADIAFGLGETFDLILLMMGLFAVIFQIPLLIMLAIMMGVTTREWLEGNRLLFWFAFAGIAFLFSPDPTGMAPIMVGLTMVGLFELTLGLLRWTGR